MQGEVPRAMYAQTVLLTALMLINIFSHSFILIRLSGWIMFSARRNAGYVLVVGSD